MHCICDVVFLARQVWIRLFIIMVLSLHVQYVGHVVYVWNLHMSRVRIRVHVPVRDSVCTRVFVCVRLCPYVFVCVSACVRMCSRLSDTTSLHTWRVYTHDNFTDTACLHTRQVDRHRKFTKQNKQTYKQTHTKTQKNDTSLQPRGLFRHIMFTARQVDRDCKFTDMTS